MRTKLYGRENELKLLKGAYESSKAELAVVYGRRRVGKSYLIKRFSSDKKYLSFEGIEGGSSRTQVENFQIQLQKQISNPLLQRAKFETWNEIFDYLSTYFAEYNTKHKKHEKLIVIFDEFQWMAAQQSKLVALLKMYWDNDWKNKNIYLFLCGSIASFMVKKVIRSRALYGRITQQLQIKKLLPIGIKKFFKGKRSDEEILKYILILGGVPKYLEDIDLNRSFEQNIQALFFDQNALYLDEFEKIFNVHFKEPRTYLKIIRSMDKKLLSLDEIAQSLNVKSSGGFKIYLDNLELAEFIRSTTSYESSSLKYPRYKVSDEFSWFFIKYVLLNIRLIREGGGSSLLRSKIIPNWESWFGFAFENYCVNNAFLIANIAGFSDKVESFGPYFRKSEPGVQVDLIFKRTDKVITVCEMKYRSKKITAGVIPEVQNKIEKLKIPKGYSVEKVLLAPNGASDELIESGFFNNIVTTADFFA